MVCKPIETIHDTLRYSFFEIFFIHKWVHNGDKCALYQAYDLIMKYITLDRLAPPPSGLAQNEWLSHARVALLVAKHHFRKPQYLKLKSRKVSLTWERPDINLVINEIFHFIKISISF